MLTKRILPKRALISVSNKTGVVEFAGALVRLGVELLSTGGTAQQLRDAGIAVTEVAEHTGFPEIMAGRVKTLHPKIHGGLLGRRGDDDATMAAHNIAPIDLLAVNLYPFEQTVAAGCTLAEAIENIDIGGPAMLRSAAKNHASVAVVVDTDDYVRVLAELGEGGLSDTIRAELAAKAFAHTARYDAAISNYLSALPPQQADDAPALEAMTFPRNYSVQFRRSQLMRYGENPHQQAALYAELDPPPASLVAARQLQGKALSYNNVADSDAALACVRAFSAPACVIVKHANPCGVALGASPLEAYQRAFATDPTSAFGGIIAFNRELDADVAAAIVDRQFVEVIIAPAVNDAALAVLAAKTNIRVLAVGQPPSEALLGGMPPSGTPPGGMPPSGTPPGWDYKRVSGGLLVQQLDSGSNALVAADLNIVSQRHPSAHQLDDLLFAWKVAKYVKSNAIVYARDGATVGIGAGQMSRVYSARIAAIKAADEGLEVAGAVLASDAFFPFRDGLDAAAEVGIRAVIQPGGSVRDEEVIAAADEHDIAMVFTAMRHFRH